MTVAIEDIGIVVFLRLRPSGGSCFGGSGRLVVATMNESSCCSDLSGGLGLLSLNDASRFRA